MTFLKALFEAESIKLQRLADITGINIARISLISSGKSQASKRERRLICSFFDLPESVLFPGEENEAIG